MYRLICQKPAHFLSAHMALVSTFFQMLIVLGTYNFALEALCFLGQLQAPENLYDATLYFGGQRQQEEPCATHNRNRTQFCVSPLASKQQEPYAILRTKSMSERNVVGRASLDRLTSQEEQHEGKAEFNISVKI